MANDRRCNRLADAPRPDANGHHLITSFPKSQPLTEPRSLELDLELSSPPTADADAVLQLPRGRRWFILLTLCWTALPCMLTSSSILAATSEVAAELNTSSHAINIVNAGVFVAMALCPFIWLPLSNLAGRRTTLLLVEALLCACLLASALSPNMTCFAGFWMLGGSTTPFLLVAGQTIVADVFEPTIRGTATGIFLGTCVGANMIAPLMGAVIASFTTWRAIYGVSAGVTFVALILCFFVVPKSRDGRNPAEVVSRWSNKHNRRGRKQPRWRKADILEAFDPTAVFRQLKYPNVLFSHLACGLLGFNMYALLSSVRRVINPRFSLTSPLTSGLFYLAPGSGFILGSTVGGRLSDQIVRLYIRKRNGVRLPQDRLRSGLPAVLVILPAGGLVYGWSLERELGGMPLPAISSFIQGFGLMASFSGLNTYASEVLPGHRTAVISSKYLLQYFFAAGSVGGIVPMIDSIGVGWAFTVCSMAAMVAGVFLLGIAFYGSEAQAWVDKENLRNSRETHMSD